MSSTTFKKTGFTLVEVLASLGISSIIVLAMLIAFGTNARQYQHQRNLIELRHNARSAIDIMMRDVRSAGYGVPVPWAEIPQWVDWGPGVSNIVTIVEGSTPSDPDELLLFGAIGTERAELNSAVTRGSTFVQVGLGEGSMFGTGTRRLLLIGHTELARVVSVTGDQLGISTDPTVAAGLRYDYPSNTPVELLQLVRYACHTAPTGFPYRPYLVRDTYDSGVSNDLQRLFMLGIDDFQARATNGMVEVEIRGRSQRELPRYVHPTMGDGYVRATLVNSTRARNVERE